MDARVCRVLALALALIACGCSSTQDELVLPWCKYRLVKTPGGSGILSGSSYREVLVSRWWGWSKVFDGSAGPGRPVVIGPTTALVMSSGVAWVLRKSDAAASLACGDRHAVATVPPAGGFIDCVDHLAGPAAAVATSLRVRRFDPDGRSVAQIEYSAGDAGRVFLAPAISFYDDEGTSYLVSFRDPWTQTLPDGSEQRGQSTQERLSQIACELIPVAKDVAPVPAPQGHKIADCSTAAIWSRVIGRRLRDPWKS